MRKLKPSILLPLLLILAACVGTKSAYQAADTLDEQAYVITEHYAAVVKEAANLAQQPGTPRKLVEGMQAADRAAKPIIVGLAPVVARYTAIKNAQTEAELQAAVNDALLALTNLINSVKAARNAS